MALQQAVFIFTSVIANRRIDAKMGEVKEKKVVLLTKDTGWYGGHSGYYEQLPRYLADQGARVDLVKPRRSLTRRFVGKLYSYTRSWPERDQSLTFAELHFRRILSKSPHAVGHVLNFEEHYLLFSPGERVRKNTVATIHIPPSGWDALMRDCLPQLSKAIVLYRRDIKFLEGRIGAGKVRFIPHGVDTDFFRPGTGFASTPKAPSIVFSGQYLRNIEMLNRVIHKLRYLHPELRFDLIVPKHALANDGFRDLRSVIGIEWHQGVTDEQLLLLYQNAYLMLLPMNESGANNSVVEALATGLPIVTTDVGGIRDYGGDSLFPVVGNNDDTAMLELVERYLKNPGWRQFIGNEQRKFALKELSWAITAKQHMEVYQEISANE